jgi:hypothetical protein
LHIFMINQYGIMLKRIKTQIINIFNKENVLTNAIAAK